MKKWTKWLIAAAVIIAVIVGVIIYVKFADVWTVVVSAVAGIMGVAVGWFAKVGYDKYRKEE